MFEELVFGVKDAAGGLDARDINGLNPLVLAYLGDAVYDIFIRTCMVVQEPNKNVHQLHVMTTGYVKAHAQSDVVHKISPLLTEEELSIIRRGRNSKSGYVPKNADVIEYRNATGFEALLGYLYLTGNGERLIEVLKLSISDGEKSESPEIARQ